MACGEGYGAAVLARRAASVVGLDANLEAYEHARLRYQAPNLTFDAWDGRELRRARQLRCGRVPADDRARIRSAGGSGPSPLAARRQAERSTSRHRTCSRSRPRAQRSPRTRGTCGNTGRRSSSVCARLRSRPCRCSACSTRASCAYTSWRSDSAGTGFTARSGSASRFYDCFTPAIAASDFTLRATQLDRALDFLAVCR